MEQHPNGDAIIVQVFGLDGDPIAHAGGNRVGDGERDAAVVVVVLANQAGGG